MPSPWEKYQQAPAEPSQPAAPWAKYSQEPPAEQPGLASQVASGLKANVDMIREPATTLVTGTAALPISGVAMLGAGATNALGISDIDLTALGERIQRALTYEPKTKAGKLGNKVVSYPFEKLAQFGDFLGQKTDDTVRAVGGDKTAAAAGAAVNTATQLLPALVAKRVGSKTPVQQAQAAAEAQARARTYVDTRVNAPDPLAPEKQPISFDSLAQGTRDAITKVAQSPNELGALDPAAVARQANLESLPVPIKTTNARITRDPVALRNEGNVAATEAGRPIRQVFVDNNAKLIENIQTLQGKKPSRGDVETGRAVQDTARAKLDVKKAEVKKAYDEAKASGELQGKVSPKPVLDVLNRAADKTDLKWVEGWLNANKVVQETPSGRVVNKLTLETLEGLRQDATARVKNGGSDGYHASKIVRAIDQATAGAGGVKYKAARKARTEQGIEFQDQKAVARLVDDKTRTDRTVALEDTWNDVVLRGSLDDLVKVKKSLLTGGDAATRTAGKNAWRDMRAETIAYIEREATKGVQLLEDGRPNVSPAALKRAVDKIGTEKLDQIFGSGTRKALDRIVTAARDLKTEPTAVHGGSSTMSNALAFLEKSLGKIPGGSVVSGAARAVGQVKSLGDAGRTVREAARDPLSDAAARVDTRNKLRQYAPASAVQDKRQ